jgi:hypothetical protein
VLPVDVEKSPRADPNIVVTPAKRKQAEVKPKKQNPSQS